MNRRQFLKITASFAAWNVMQVGAAEKGTSDMSASGQTIPNARKLPRWRGFNLLEKFTDRRNAPFRESDFELMAEWGFDFARLPLSYRCWADVNDWLNLNEDALKEIDQAVEFGRQHGVHVNINFHRGPGYCVTALRSL